MFRAEDVAHDRQVREENVRYERENLVDCRRDVRRALNEIEEIAGGFDPRDDSENEKICGQLQDKVRLLAACIDGVQHCKKNLRSLGANPDE